MTGVQTCALPIYLAYCRISDMGVLALADNCPLLNNIVISGCSKITDVGVSAVADNCPELWNINLSDCTEISDILSHIKIF